jgi:hypothetical protein
MHNPHTGQSQKGGGVGAELVGESPHLRQAAGENHGVGVIGTPQGAGHAADDGVNVLDGTGEFHTVFVAADIDTECLGGKNLGNQRQQGFISAGDHTARVLVLHHFFGEVRTAQYAYAGLGQLLGEYFTHEREVGSLYAFGGTDDHGAGAYMRCGPAHHLAVGLAGNGHHHQIRPLETRYQIGGNLQIVMQAKARQIMSIFALALAFLGALGITEPQQGIVSVGRNYVGQGSAKTATAQHRNLEVAWVGKTQSQTPVS